MPTLSSPGLKVVCGLVAARKMLSGFRSPINRSPFSLSLSASLAVAVRSEIDPRLDLDRMSKLGVAGVSFLAPSLGCRIDIGVDVLVAVVVLATGRSSSPPEVCTQRFLPTSQ